MALDLRTRRVKYRAPTQSSATKSRTRRAMRRLRVVLDMDVLSAGEVLRCWIEGMDISTVNCEK